MKFEKIAPVVKDVKLNYNVEYKRLYHKSGLTRKCWCKLLRVDCRTHTSIMHDRYEVSRILVNSAHNLFGHVKRCFKSYRGLT